ncbi:MAG: hypothetical protein PWQ37_2959 [Candidatus Petromonas sp.]|nr:hypothetical protein [Candidatus Petromonas sp.]
MKYYGKMPIHGPLKMEDFELPKTIIIDQPYVDRYPLDEALEKGTLFPNLYRPYKPHKKEYKK